MGHLARLAPDLLPPTDVADAAAAGAATGDRARVLRVLRALESTASASSSRADRGRVCTGSRQPCVPTSCAPPAATASRAADATSRSTIASRARLQHGQGRLHPPQGVPAAQLHASRVERRRADQGRQQTVIGAVGPVHCANWSGQLLGHVGATPRPGRRRVAGARSPAGRRYPRRCRRPARRWAGTCLPLAARSRRSPS